MKRTMMLMAAAGVAALAVPGGAAATWQHNGGNLASNANITITGQQKIQGQVGSVECQVITNIELTAGTTTAHGQFDVDNGGAANDEEKCSVGGGLVSLGCTDPEQVTIQGPLVDHAVSPTAIDVTTGTTQFHLTGGLFCPQTIQYTPGTLTITAGQHLFQSVEFSGNLKLHAPSGEQQVTVSGSGSVTPSGTYGVA